ncbi:hypothetical protein [Actinomyces viscosus]|uniref:hypothetical protein n=1 Tax=Actinomyces viscosus TaxID=1656 RepID=UPI001E5DC7DF|nr:hypothetical protein [Actinomyces viscosus]
MSYKRHARSAANELWQIDGFEWRLEERLVTIYQVAGRLLAGHHRPEGVVGRGERGRHPQRP